MRAFLLDHGGVGPERIDNESILLFWIHMAQSPAATEVEGFRLYRSAARAMLRYRQALRDAAAYRQIGSAVPLHDDLGRQALAIAEGLGDTGFQGDSWQCPLQNLMVPPANVAKWLNKRERLQLLNYMGGPHPGQEDTDDSDKTEPESDETGLNAGERFDLEFISTLLRADVFGPVQSTIVQRIRKQVPPPIAIQEAMALTQDTAYEACAATYASIRDQLRLESLAAMAVLLEASVPEALLLLGHLGGPGAVSKLLGPDFKALQKTEFGDDEDMEQQTAGENGIQSYLATILRAGTDAAKDAPESETSILIAKANTAARRVNRIGFRRQDRGDPAVVAGLAAGAASVIGILTELDRLLAALPGSTLCAAMIADRPRFEATLRRIYLSPSGDLPKQGRSEQRSS